LPVRGHGPDRGRARANGGRACRAYARHHRGHAGAGCQGEGGDSEPDCMIMTVPAVEPSDEALAARAAAGDDSAFEAIVQRYQARVFRLACRLTSDTDAPDILQDTFLQVYRHLPTFRGDSQFGTWLYRIAMNAALMHR